MLHKIAIIISLTCSLCAQQLEIHYINVGWGGSVLVKGPNGTTLLLEAGNPGMGVKRVVPYLQQVGLFPPQGLDYTIAGHQHCDHIGGLPEVVKAGYNVHFVNYYNGSSASSGCVDDWNTAAATTIAGLPVAAPVGGQIALGNGARLTFVARNGSIIGGASVPLSASADENDRSIAVLIQYGGFDYLWASDLGGGSSDEACTGRSTSQKDLETSVIQAISPGGAFPLITSGGIDVLHVNHHGSESSTNHNYMNLSRPTLAVIGTGAGQTTGFDFPRIAVVEHVLLGQATACVTAPPAIVLQSEDGAPAGPNTSFAGYAVGNIKITTDGVNNFTVSGDGQVTQGANEAGLARLPLTLPLDDLPTFQSIGSLGQIASAGTWQSTLNALNLGTSAVSLRTNFYDNNGAPMILPLTFPQQAPGGVTVSSSSFDRILAVRAQLVVETTGSSAIPTQIGWGQFLASGIVDGFGIFTNPTYGWNAVVPLETRNASRYTLAFDNVGQLATGLALANVAASSATIPVIIRDDTGSQIGRSTISLSGHGHQSFMLNDAQFGFPLTNNSRGTIEFDTPSGGQISVLGLRANGPALTTLPVLASGDTPGGSISHITYNGGFTSVFYLVNTGTLSADFALTFYDEAGGPLSVPLFLRQSSTTMTTSNLTGNLAAGALLVVETQAQDGLASISGSAKLASVGSISGFEIFRWTTFGQEASVPLETRTPGSFILVFDDTNGLTTGVALANQNSAAATVISTIYDDAGALLKTETINLAAHGHTSFLLPNTFTVTANKRGIVEFTVPQGGKISAVGLRAKTDGTLTTIPVLAK